jgi:nitrous-oxide reductase
MLQKGEGECKSCSQGNQVHVYMTSIRSHFSPDNIEGVKSG